jgi:hypothetical protein
MDCELKKVVTLLGSDTRIEERKAVTFTRTT